MGLGLAVSIDAHLGHKKPDQDEVFQFRTEDNVHFEAVDQDGNPAQLSSLRFKIEPIARDRRSHNHNEERWSPMRQDENPVTRQRDLEAADALSTVVHHAQTRLLTG